MTPPKRRPRRDDAQHPRQSQVTFGAKSGCGSRTAKRTKNYYPKYLETSTSDLNDHTQTPVNHSKLSQDDEENQEGRCHR